MKQKILLFIRKYLNDELEFRAQVFNLLVMTGMVLGIAIAIISAIISAGIVNIIVNLLASIFAFVMLRYSNRTGHYERCYLITVVTVFMIAFPILFFGAGGYRSGMPSFFIFALVFSILMLKGKRIIICAALEIVIYIGICLIAYRYPETVSFFETEWDMTVDILVGFMATGAALGITIFRYTQIYNNKQQQLDRLNDMKTEFLGNVSHELKTPLTSVSGFARYSFRVMENENLSDGDITEMRDNLRRIVVEADRMKRVVEQLLDVAAIEQGKFGLRKQQVSISELADEIKGLHFRTLNTNDNRLEIHIAHELPNIEADHDRLLQVLLNLLSNALRHTTEGVVTLSTWVEDRQIALRMTDNGEGIPAEIQKTLFERYLGADIGRAHGTGLGLYICKQIVEAHGGKIWIKSEPGAGTEVHFTLPLDKEDEHG